MGQAMDATYHYCVRLFCALSAMVLMLTGCEQEPTPISAEHVAFVGVWEQGKFGGDTTYEYLQISASGYFSYARIEKSDGVSTCVVIEKMPIESITNRQISVSVLWFFTSDFEINKPPTAVGDSMRMTIDGNELTRTDIRQDRFDYAWSCTEGDLYRNSVT